MLQEDISGNDGLCLRYSFLSNSQNDHILSPNTGSSQLPDCLGRKEDRHVLVESAFSCVRKTTTAGRRPSAPMAFLQRTMARFRRQPKRASLPGEGLTGNQAQRPLSDITPHLEGCEAFTSFTRLVLRSSDDVSFSPSSFFRTVEQVSTLNGCSDTIPLVPLLPSPPLRPPPLRPRRRPPPSVDDEIPARTISALTPHAPSSKPPKHNSTGSRKPLLNKKGFDSLLELQALAVELDKLDPLDSPPRQLHASPSIEPSCSLWAAPPSPAANLDRDPLTELLAVAEELKTMKSLDSDDILYLTDAPPLSPLPPTLHAFLDAPDASLHILEMDVHSEDETFLGIPIPCIVVTSEGEALPVEVLAMKLPHSSPSEDHLAPPPTTYRGRMEYDQLPSIITPDDGDDHDDGRARGFPSELASSFSSSPCEEEDLGSCSLSSFRDYSECSDANMNLSWEVISDIVSSSSPSNQRSKPVRPTAPKPAPLLRRRERSLLRRMLGSGGHVSALAVGVVEKDKRSQVPSPKRERIYLSKEAIGLPRPLSPVSQSVAASQPDIMGEDSPL
jgi:hypothetical protein